MAGGVAAWKGGRQSGKDTDEGRNAVREAMATYGEGVRTHFLGRLSRPQIAAMGENCRRVSVALKTAEQPAKLGRV